MDQQTAALLAKAWPRQIAFLVVMALLVFVPTGTVHFWQAWLFLAVFAVLTIAMGAYFVVTDPALVACVGGRCQAYGEASAISGRACCLRS